MNLIKVILFFTLSILLAACGGGRSTSTIVDTTSGVHIKCADIYESGSSDCDTSASAGSWFLGAAHAALEVNAGTISRAGGALVTSRTDVDNPLAEAKTVWIEMKFDANCAGQPGEWVILLKQSIDIPANDIITNAVGGMCGDMPLGERTLTTTVWNDQDEVIDFSVVRFTLIE